MENMCGIKMFSAQDICKGLHVTKETAYAIMKMKESGARYVGRKLLISEDNLMNKNMKLLIMLKFRLEIFYLMQKKLQIQ